MAFVPKKFDSGKVMLLPLTASDTVTKGELCLMSSGYITGASGGDNEVEYLALETATDATATNGGTLVQVLPIDDVMVFEALCSTTPVQATHVGNNYDLTDAATVNLAASTDNIFHIDRIVSAADSLVEGRFNKPAIA